MTSLVTLILIFMAVGAGFLFMNLLVGRTVRPSRPNAEKSTVYECGEPAVGTSYIQFDLRFYVVALLFVIFDVEMAFFFPWATVFGEASNIARQDPGNEAARDLAWIAFGDILFFFAVLVVGFAYLWKRGDLDWVRSTESYPVDESSPEV